MENIKQKCSSQEHDTIDAIVYCQECKVYLCNKCENFHSKLLKYHNINKLDKDIKEIFTEFCKEENHFGKLDFYCKTHNQLCCSDCLCKFKIKGKGTHQDCDVCILENIKNEKQNKLKENIKLLQNLSNTVEKLINELKVIIEKINNNKEELKLKIQKIFTKIRNNLNDREDELLLEVDKEFNNAYFKEESIKDFEKLPNKIKDILEKSNNIDIELKNEKKLCEFVNDCINIENNIKDINLIKENVDKCNNSINSEIIFFPNENDNEFNQFLKNMQIFGEVNCKSININTVFKFKKCPNNINKDKEYKVSGNNNNIM